MSLINYFAWSLEGEDEMSGTGDAVHKSSGPAVHSSHTGYVTLFVHMVVCARELCAATMLFRKPHHRCCGAGCLFPVCKSVEWCIGLPRNALYHALYCRITQESQPAAL
jgi:hypothetical protein